MRKLDYPAASNARRSPARTTLGIVCGLLLAGQVFALGLGGVSGQAIIGQPLRIEIPLIGVDAAVPSSDCFRIRPPQVEMDPSFVLKGGRVDVVSDKGRPRLVITTTAPVREPVVEFAVAAACGADFAKDYLLLSSVPAKPAVETVSAPVVTAPAAPAPVERAAATQPAPQLRLDVPAAPAVAGPTLRIDAETSLEALARRNYPLQPKAREKYVRMMKEANPGIGEVVPAGSALKIPSGLPVRRVGPYRPEGTQKAAAEAPAVVEQQSQPAVHAAPPPVRNAGSNDVLRLGQAPARSNADLLAEAERLTAVLMEQVRTEEEVAANLTRIEGEFKALKEQYAAVQSRLARVETEREAEKAAAKSQIGMVELVLAVLSGGALGGAGLHFYNRRRRPDGGLAAPHVDMEAPVAAAAPLAPIAPIAPIAPVPPPRFAVPPPHKDEPDQPSLSFTGDK